MRKSSIFIVLAATIFTACQESLEERCARESREFTQKKCPTLVTKGVTIDSMSFDKATHTMTYHYTLTGVLDDAEQLAQHDIRSMLLTELKNSPQTLLYKEAGYNFRYIYYSGQKKGTKLFEATFHENDYR